MIFIFQESLFDDACFRISTKHNGLLMNFLLCHLHSNSTNYMVYPYRMRHYCVGTLAP